MSACATHILSICITLCFNSLLELELKFTEINQINKSEATCPMTLEEENALPYVGGYVCHKVRDKIIKSNVKDKELIFFCFELCGDEDGKCGTMSEPI